MAQSLNPLGQRITGLLHGRGWNQGDLADKLGVSVSTVGRIVQGVKRPKPGEITAIAKALGTDSAELEALLDHNGGEARPPTETEREIVRILSNPGLYLQQDQGIVEVLERLDRQEAMLRAIMGHLGLPPPG